MKRRTKKLVLPLLLSGVLIGSNVCYVCAQGQIADITSDVETPTGENLPTGGDVTEPVVQPETVAQTSQTDQKDQTEAAAQTEETTQPDTGEQTEETAKTETETRTEETTETETDVTETETDATTSEGENEADTGEGTENPNVTDNSELPEGTAAADETENVSEKTFVNGNGEEVLPSTLIGVDYNTISQIYDGAANVVKQYVISDTYEKDTIIDCSIDEEGNMVMLISLGVPESEVAKENTNVGILESVGEKLESVFGDNSSAPAVDGSFTGWDDIPASYEFNWNKPDAWVDGVHYTETNSTDVRHEMKLYSDGENVYLRVVFAREFCNGQVANGNDYQFWIDDTQMAAYQVEWPDGSSLSYNTAEPGTYQVEVRHRDSSWSYVLTDGAVAYYHVNEGNLNNELELKIPISEFVKQNPDINLDNYSMISFFTPNLMQGKLSAAGASTGAEPFAAAVFLLVPTSYICIKKKDKKEMAFA